MNEKLKDSIVLVATACVTLPIDAPCASLIPTWWQLFMIVLLGALVFAAVFGSQSLDNTYRWRVKQHENLTIK
jgi:hypothetical protein